MLSLVLLLAAFFGEILHMMPQMFDLMHIDPEQVILAVLSLIDLSLAGNLVVIVIFSGYENFVSKIDTGGSERPAKLDGQAGFLRPQDEADRLHRGDLGDLAAARLHDPDRAGQCAG